MQEYTDPVDRLVKLNEVIRFILLDEAVGEYLSEGPFGRSRGSGRPMPQRYIEAQRLRDSMKQQRISANFQRTMELKQRDQARSDAFREMVRQDRFSDAVARYKARRAGAQAAPATTGAAPTTGTQGTSPVATAQPDAGLPSAPGKGGPQSTLSRAEMPASEVQSILADPERSHILGTAPGEKQAARRASSEEQMLAAEPGQVARGEISMTTAERMAAAKAQREKDGTSVPSDFVPGKTQIGDRALTSVQGQVDASRERAAIAKEADRKLGLDTTPSAAEQARRERSERAMEGGLSLVQRRPVVRDPLKRAISNVTRGMNQPQQSTSSAELIRRASTERQVNGGPRPNENLGMAPAQLGTGGKKPQDWTK